MRFAWSRAIAEESSDQQASTDVGDDLAAVELLTEAGRRVAWIDTQGQRTSDWLNAHPRIPVHGLTSTVPEDGTEPAAPSSASPEDMDRDAVVWLVPPPLPPNRHLRLHRRRVLVHIELDDHKISGQAHVRPGADAIDQVLRGTREMVPLTEVQIVSRHDPGEGTDLPVLIVNRRHVRRVVIDAPHMSPAVPDLAAQTADGVPLDPRIAWLVAETAQTEASGVEADAAAAQAKTPATVPGAPSEVSGVELLNSALTLLLETGMIDVVEFQSIRARIPAPAG